jgi:hypothetical protein
MFTDDLVTPRRLEIILDVLRGFPKREWKKELLYQLVQPDGLPEKTGQRQQAKATIAAADELGLIEEGTGGVVRLKGKTQRSTRELVLEAIDREVLATTQIEPWFAPFYSYLLWLGEKAAKGLSRDAWAAAFNRDVLNDRPAKNQFNGTKYSGLLRWFSYAGLGWTDSLGIFQPNPYGRVARGLPVVFDGDARLTSDDFMSRIGAACPELDGGTIFRQTNTNWTPDARLCSLGLSHALVDLHLDKVLVLAGTVDSRGWSVASAVPPGGDPFGRFDFVEYTGRTA